VQKPSHSADHVIINEIPMLIDGMRPEETPAPKAGAVEAGDGSRHYRRREVPRALIGGIIM